jgi:hypothetical protein
MNKNTNTHRITPDQAPLIAQIFTERGGIAIWKANAPNRAGESWTTPIKGPNGEEIQKLRPHGSTREKPDTIITDPKDVIVETPALFKRFPVGIQRSSDGLKYRLTDASLRRLQRVQAQAAKKSELRGQRS